jgi:dTDP-4-dehydrorhamnose reductase
MKRILITGAGGQLGSALREAAGRQDQYSFNYLDIQDLDLTDASLVQRYFSGSRFDYVINCAAYTAVDLAENEPDQAFSINAGVPALLGKICLEQSAFLLHLSTDYVYSGVIGQPHTEEENPVALSVYAKSKLQGELYLRDNHNALVIRTSWLYSEYGYNFLKTMLRLSNERSELSIVFDQVGTPTYAGDLADALVSIISFSEREGFRPGTYNYSNEGVCSWYDFASEIMQLAGRSCVIKPIRTSEYPLPAIRPAYSVMDKRKIKNTFGIEILHWKQSLRTAMNNLNDTNLIR